jgi:hypothetical protein
MKNGGVMSFEASSSISGIANYFLTAINDRNGNALTITRDSGRNITEMSSADYILTTSNQRGYDANGRITQEQYADGSVMQFVYTLEIPLCPYGFERP